MPQPAAPEPAAEDIQLISVDTAQSRSDPLLDQPQYTAEDREEARREERRLLTSLGIEQAPEYTGQRKLPWPIDILLYPANMAGLTSLAVIVGVPLLLGLLGPVVWMVPFMGLFSILAEGLVALYAVWYFAECVYDSARGGTRAPQAFDTGDTGEMWSRAAYILLVFILFVGPMMVYFFATGKRDVILWTLVAWAAVFFPISLLAMVLHDSLSALNPLFLLGSVLRAFIPYMGFVLLLAAIVVGLAWVWPPPFVPSVVCLVIGPYGMLILAHILGRFYWRNREKLDWGI